MPAKLLVCGLVILKMLGVATSNLKPLQASDTNRIKIVRTSHIPSLLQHYNHKANRSPKKVPWKPDNRLSPRRCRTCSTGSSDDRTAGTEDGPEKEAGFNMRHQVPQTVQQCLEPRSDLRFWYRVLLFRSFGQDFHLTQVVEQRCVIAWENGKVFTDFLSCPPRTGPPAKQVHGNEYHTLKFPIALFKDF